MPETPMPPPRAPRGTIVRAPGKGRAQVIRSSGKRWTDRAEDVFLAHLATTANVRASAAVAGFSATTLYKRRMAWPGFAARWNTALEQGYVRIEALLIERATATLSGDIGVGGKDGPPVGEDIVLTGPAMTVAEAMNMLKLHRAAVRGGPPQRYKDWSAPLDLDAIRASIHRKIDAIVRARAPVSGPA